MTNRVIYFIILYYIILYYIGGVAARRPGGRAPGLLPGGQASSRLDYRLD